MYQKTIVTYITKGTILALCEARTVRELTQICIRIRHRNMHTKQRPLLIIQEVFNVFNSKKYTTLQLF